MNDLEGAVGQAFKAVANAKSPAEATGRAVDGFSKSGAGFLNMADEEGQTFKF